MKTGYSGISVVIPCLNEAESIGRAVQAASQGLRTAELPGEVIVVDNGSSDESAKMARLSGARVIFEEERGYGAALRKGLVNAKYDLLIMGDGDLSYDFTKIHELIEPILEGKAEFVVGNRLRNLRPDSMPSLHKYIGNPILSLMLRVMFHTHTIKDAHCGLRAITRKAYEELGCVTTGMEFASEMIVRAIHNKVKIAEKDIIYHPRVGESKLASFKDGWRHLRFLVLHSPSWTLILPGALMWVLGMVIAIPLTFGPVKIYGHQMSIHSMIMGGILNVISIQLISMGMIAKAYAHFSGLREDPFIIWLYGKFTFEKLILYTLPIALIGLALTVKVIIAWVIGGFGPLDEAKTLFLGMLFLINGTQIWAAGYVLSVLALPRHLGRFPVEKDPNNGKTNS